MGLVIVTAMLSGNAQARSSLQLVKKHPVAPGFSLPDLAGQTISLTDFRGKVVVVNFWATWCLPCRVEMPALERASKTLKDDNVVIIGVHVGGTEKQVQAFVRAKNLTFAIVLDKTSKVAHKWPMRGLPTTFIIDRQGHIAYQAIGKREWDAEEMLNALRYAASKGENR